MPIKHVYGPTRGEIDNMPPTLLPPEGSPYIKGCYLKNGVVKSDFGYVDFPTTGATATNELLGTVMFLDQFYLLDGTSHLLALTTTSMYKYNTNSTWEDVTFGVDLDDCEDAWTDRSGDTTCSADTTYFLQGSKSAKMIVPAAVTQELIASWNTTSDLDCSAHRYLHFWVYLSVATTADQIRFRIAEDDDGAATNTYCDWDIGALAADKWHHVSIDLDGTPEAGTYTDHTDLDSVDSIALYLQDTAWAGSIYIDQVRIVTQFTGDEDNRFSTTTMNDTFLLTNGIDQPQKITESGGTITVAELTTTLATGSITTSELVFAFKDHVCLMNNTENSADTPQRVSWTNIGALEDWTVGTAGYQDLVDSEDWIMGVAMMSENQVAIYKERSIVTMTWVGGHTPFRFTTMVTGTGAVSKDAITNMGGEHIILGPDVVYSYKGGTDIEVLDDSVRDVMYANLNREFSNRAFLMYLEEDDEVQIWIPSINDDPDEVWCYNVTKQVWYRKDRRCMGYGFYKKDSTLTIGDLIGTIGDQNFRLGDALTKAYAPVTLLGDTDGKVYEISKSTNNNDGTAIANEFQTPDFVLPDTPDYMTQFMRVNKLYFEAYGDSVTTTYSTDGGGTWSPTSTAGNNSTTLSGSFDLYEQDFDTVARKIRFKFYNNTASSTFNLRYYGFYWIKRSGRR